MSAPVDVLKVLDVVIAADELAAGSRNEDARHARSVVEELIEAIKPLAMLDLRPGAFDTMPDNQTVYARDASTITVGDVRRAAKALSLAKFGGAA